MASSDSIIRDVYRQVTGREIDDVTLNSLRGVPDEQLSQAINSGGGSTATSGDDYMAQLINSMKEVQSAKDEPYQRYGEYQKNNPFSFDEKQARAAAEEQYDPYYQAELKDFTTGIERQRSRSQVDEAKLRQEITANTDSYVGKTRQQIQDAIDSSKEGFAGAGLYFSGKRIRSENRIGMEGEQNISDYTRQQQNRLDESNTRQQRLGEDLTSQMGTYNRNWTANRETALQNAVSNRKLEDYNKYAFEAGQYAGGPLADLSYKYLYS